MPSTEIEKDTMWAQGEREREIAFVDKLICASICNRDSGNFLAAVKRGSYQKTHDIQDLKNHCFSQNRVFFLTQFKKFKTHTCLVMNPLVP